MVKITLFFIVLIHAILPCLAQAHTENDQPTVQETVIRNSYYQVSGVALAIANSQLQFDSTTYQTQLGVGAGNFDGSNALSVGVAKRFCEHCPLVNGSIGQEGDKTGVGVGFTLRF